MKKKYWVLGVCILSLTVIVILFCMHRLSGSGMMAMTSSWEREAGGRDRIQTWHKIPPYRRRKGIALVVHGLNLKPEKMQVIIRALNDARIETLNLSLRGHGRNYTTGRDLSMDDARLEALRHVSYALWLHEVYEAYLAVKERAATKDLPVFLIGYSLGGLMMCDLVLSYPDIDYDRMVLFAPALNLSPNSYLLKVFMPFPNMVIDSLSPLAYRANEGTPIAAYSALFEAVEYFEKHMDDRLNKPTIIFINEGDEFISSPKLKDMILRHHLDQWHIQSVQKDPGGDGKFSNHLIIDQTSTGENAWKEIKRTMIRHVLARP